MKNPDSTINPPSSSVNLSEKHIARFWAKVDKNGPTQPHMETPCWIWTACKDKNGYGQFRQGKSMALAHRVAWLITNGAIPHDGSAHGICVCHRCDRRDCTRIDHLFLGTNADNNADMVAKKRGVAPSGDAHYSRCHPERMARGNAHGSRTHPERRPRGEDNANAKLTACKVVEIRTIHAAGGITKAMIATQFGVERSVIGRIINRKAWKHIL